MRPAMNLSDQTLQQWLQVLKAQPTSQTGLMEWVTGPLKRFFPFERVLLGHGEDIAGQIQVTHVLADGHTPEYLQHIGATFTLQARGAMQWWLKNRQPFTLDATCPPPFATAFELREIEDFQLGRVAAHGILNAKTNAGTYFSFAGIPVSMSDWHLDALTLIVPVLNDLFLSFVAAQNSLVSSKLNKLTPRQKDVARLIASGTNDKAIAKKLAISEKTVRNHLSSVYALLGVHKRGQLIAMLR